MSDVFLLRTFDRPPGGLAALCAATAYRSIAVLAWVRESGMDNTFASSPRAQSADSIWEPDRFYRAYWEGAHEGLYIVRCLGGGDFVYEGINPAHERATGLSRADLV